MKRLYSREHRDEFTDGCGAWTRHFHGASMFNPITFILATFAYRHEQADDPDEIDREFYTELGGESGGGS
jgi:hypothetical protein